MQSSFKKKNRTFRILQLFCFSMITFHASPGVAIPTTGSPGAIPACKNITCAWNGTGPKGGVVGDPPCPPGPISRPCSSVVPWALGLGPPRRCPVPLSVQSWSWPAPVCSPHSHGDHQEALRSWQPHKRHRQFLLWVLNCPPFILLPHPPPSWPLLPTRQQTPPSCPPEFSADDFQPYFI